MNISVFHDESGDYGNSEWILTGLLWIDEKLLPQIDKELKYKREEEDYLGEIHFNKFPRSFKGDFGPKARVAQKWFELWWGKWADSTWFNVLAVNTRHTKYEHRRFTRGFHAYNRFTAITLKSGLAWHFNEVDSLVLQIYSDEKSRRPKGLLGDGIDKDNFEQYLTWRLGKDTKSYKGPKVYFKGSVRCISCPKKGPFTQEEELLQLTDLLLGAVSTAVKPKSNRETKLWFGKEIAKLIQDVRRKPWEQQFGLHRRFSVSYFPDNKVEIYTNGPIEIARNKSQLSLFNQ